MPTTLEAAEPAALDDRDALAARYEELLRREGAALARVAAAYERDPARRDDLFQEICLAVWRALPRFRGEASERTFVFRIAHNRGLSHRSRRPAPTLELSDVHELAEATEADVLTDPRPSPEDAAGESQRRERLRAAVLALPLPLRQVLTLTLEGLSQREVGQVLGISENNVAVRLTRARRALKQALGAEGGAP